MVAEGPASPVNETVAVLIGQRRGRVWEGRLRRFREGSPTTVEFDWAWVLAREEQHGDVIGFYHTHPSGVTTPSKRDVRTMRAWVGCFGKPLLCVIESGAALTAYVFETDEDEGRPLAEVQRRAQAVVAFDVEWEFPAEDSGR
jgi:hypothetical protein